MLQISCSFALCCEGEESIAWSVLKSGKHRLDYRHWKTFWRFFPSFDWLLILIRLLELISLDLVRLFVALCLLHSPAADLCFVHFLRLLLLLIDRFLSGLLLFSDCPRSPSGVKITPLFDSLCLQEFRNTCIHWYHSVSFIFSRNHLRNFKSPHLASMKKKHQHGQVVCYYLQLYTYTHVV